MLYIVSTPIGNLGDITYRAVSVLGSVDAILCEDTRHTAVLLNHYKISKPLISYQKFSEREKAGYIADRLERGENLALVSDAGTPLICDPGKVLLDEVRSRGLDYTVVPGACAALNAAVLSGFDLSSFCMCGFLPEKTADKIRFVERFETLGSTLVFYVPPHDARAVIAFLGDRLGDRKAALVREITKIHEQTHFGTLRSFGEFVERGEMVLVVEGAPPRENPLVSLSVPLHVEHHIALGKSKKEAVRLAASERGVPKSEVYAEYEKYLERENNAKINTENEEL